MAFSPIRAARSALSRVAAFLGPEPRDPSRADGERIREIENALYGYLLDIKSALWAASHATHEARLADRDCDPFKWASAHFDDAQTAIDDARRMAKEARALLHASQDELHPTMFNAGKRALSDLEKRSNKVDLTAWIPRDSIKKYRDLALRGEA